MGQSVYFSDIRFQRLHRIVDTGGRMGELPAESRDNTAADHAAVFIIGLGQHDEKLGDAALGDDIPLAQIADQSLL